MDLHNYSRLAASTAPDMGLTGNFLHAALGIGSEAGEVVDIAKREYAYGKLPDVVHIAEELGDLLWYINLGILSAGLTWEGVMQANIDKLSVRYPNLQFSEDHALNRNKDAEREAMEAAHHGLL